LKILVIYYLVCKSDRNTIDEHLYSFKRYSGEKCYYLNAFFGVPSYIRKINFDLVIYHYTFTGLKWNGAQHFQADLKKARVLRELSGYKVAIPQDEYVNTISVCQFFADFGIKTVFTCYPPSEYQKAYPRELSGLEDYITVLTGYIDETSLAEVSSYCRPHSERTIDLGYRARKVPFWLGRHGLIKWQLTERFQEACVKKTIKADLSNDYQDVFIGKDWYRFLSNCRVVLGCEGGASMHDPVGMIRDRVEDYVMKHPDAPFDEVEKYCFEGLDGNLDLFAISPRHFEACITKTCQALVEGEYAGIFKPGVHYIEIKKDWSNIDEVVEQILDRDLCERMAKKAYEDVVKSGRYTYREFVRSVIEHVRTVQPTNPEQPGSQEILYLAMLQGRELAPFLFSPMYFLLNALCNTKFYTSSRENFYSILRRHDLEKDYQDIRKRHSGLSVKFLAKAAGVLLRLAGSVWRKKKDGR
jgi:hypothetical protein